MSTRGGVAAGIKWGRLVQKRARLGLFGGKSTQFGNKVSEDGGNRTRRQWKPNAHRKKLYSETLDEMIQLNVTTHALRSVDKAGGLDAYILSTPPRKLKSISGMRLRERLMEAKGAGKSLPGPGGAPGAAASPSDDDARERDE